MVFARLLRRPGVLYALVAAELRKDRTLYLGGRWTIRMHGRSPVAVLVSVASLGSRICRIDQFRQVDMNDWIVGRGYRIALTVAHWELVSALDRRNPAVHRHAAVPQLARSLPVHRAIR